MSAQVGRAHRLTPSGNRAAMSAGKHRVPRRSAGARTFEGGQSADRNLNDIACRTIKDDIL